MPAAGLPLPYFDKIVTEYKIQLSVKRHRDGHVDEESSQGCHFLLLPSFFILQLCTEYSQREGKGMKNHYSIMFIQ